MTKFSTLVGKAVVATTIAVSGVAAYANQDFRIDPSFTGTDPGKKIDRLIGGGITRTVASTFIGDSTVGNTQTGKGFSFYNAAVLDGLPVFGALQTGFFQSIILAEFDFTLSLVTGATGTLNSTYNITSLNVTFYGDILDGVNDPGFTVGDNSTDPTLVKGGAIKLATAVGLGGSASINAQGGSTFNPNALFTLDPVNGGKFFVDPDPFYELLFGSFTNTSQGVSVDAAQKSVYLVTEGGVTFARVSEPGVLALAGLSLVVGGFAARRRRAA